MTGERSWHDLATGPLHGKTGTPVCKLSTVFSGYKFSQNVKFENSKPLKMQQNRFS